MRLLLLNPNTSADMTRQIEHEAIRHCLDETRISAVTAAFGCEVIATRASYAIAAHSALDTFARHAGEADAVLLACFGDPGLEALREIALVPVIGMLASAVQEATSGARRFAIVTAGTGWVGMLQEQVQLCGQTQAMSGIFPVQATGLEISRNPQAFIAPLQDAIDTAVRAGADAVILGGSAMAGLGRQLRSAVALIDPLASAMRDAQRLPTVVDRSTARPALQSQGLGTALRDALLAT